MKKECFFHGRAFNSNEKPCFNDVTTVRLCAFSIPGVHFAILFSTPLFLQKTEVEPAAQRPRAIVESELHDPEAKLQAAGADLDIDVATITQVREAVMRVRDELKSLKLQAAAVDADVDLETILQMRMAVQSLRDELKTLMPEPAAQPVATITHMREVVMRVRDELKGLKLQAAAVDTDVDLTTIPQMRMAVQSLRDELKTLMPEPAAQPEPAALVSMTARELSLKISLWLEKPVNKLW